MKRTLRNLFTLLAGDLGSRALGFLITAYLARVLGTSGFGLINIGFSVLGYLMLAATPGIHLLEARNTAAVEGANTERVQAVLGLRSLLALVVWAGASGVLFLLPMEPLTRIIILLSCASLFPLALSLDWFFHGKEHFATVSAARLIGTFIYGAAAFILVRSLDEIFWVPVAFALGNVAASVLFLVRYRIMFGTVHLRWQPSLWKTILRTNAPVGVSVLLAQSAVNLPPIVVGWFVASADAGILSAALKVVFVLLMMDRILYALFLPAATRHLATAHRQEVAFVVAVVKAVLAGLIPLTMCAVVLASPAISYIFGKNYLAAIPLLQILLAYFLLTVLNTIWVCALIGSGHEREYTRAVNIGSAVLTLAILAGTLLFGTTGAATGIVLGEMATVILMMWNVRRVLAIPVFRAVSVYLAPTILMVAAVWLTASQHLGVQVAVGLAAFGTGTIVFRVLDRNEIRFLRERFV